MYKKLAIFTIIFIFIDQLIKNLVNFYMNVNESFILLKNVLNITYVHNYGAAFSIFTGARWILVLITIVVLNIIYIFFIKNKKLNKYQTIVYSMLLGGIMGNLIDRFFYGYVIDYIDIRLFNFAIFNIADSLIVISVILLIVEEVLYARNSSRRK